MAKFKRILYIGFRATLNFRKFKEFKENLILDSLKHVLASILVQRASELVNKQILTILEAETSKITESHVRKMPCLYVTQRYVTRLLIWKARTNGVFE